MGKFISINSVLYDIATSVPESDYDKLRFTEWITKGYKKLATSKKYQTNYCTQTVEEHKATLPEEAVVVNQIAYKKQLTQADAEYIKQHVINADLELAETIASDLSTMINWTPLYKETGTFMMPDTNCIYCPGKYSIDIHNCITTSFKEGTIIISYQGYPLNEEGEMMIPDNENIKDALFHYVMYRMNLRKTYSNEVRYEREFHLGQYELFKAKGKAEEEMPDLGEMENIKNNQNRLVPRSYRFDSFFMDLGNKEKQDGFNLNTYDNISQRY